MAIGVRASPDLKNKKRDTSWNILPCEYSKARPDCRTVREVSMPEQGIPRVSRRSSVSTVILPSLIDRPSLHSHRCRPSSLIADLARVVDLGNWPRRSYRREAARRSDHSDNAGHLDPRPGGARLSTSGRSPRENQAPDKESQPIHLTQENGVRVERLWPVPF